MEMSAFLADFVTAVGLATTAIGAGIAARAVILSKQQAIEIGVSRLSGDNDEEDLELPMVQNLLSTSKHAQWGLWGIVIGTLLQIVPIAIRMVS